MITLKKRTHNDQAQATRTACTEFKFTNKADAVLGRLERSVMRDFEIGDIVEIGALDEWYEVVGVIHDEERLFVATGPSWCEQEFPFGSVVAQYRRIDA